MRMAAEQQLSMIKRFDNLNFLSTARKREGIGLTPLIGELAQLQIGSTIRKSRDDFALRPSGSA